MPQLPSGRHVALSPEPLVDLLKHAARFGNVHKVMALKTWEDLWPWIEIVYFVPDAGEQERDGGELSDDSLPAPAGLTRVKGGYRVADWEQRAHEWSPDDRAALRADLDERARKHFRAHLAVARDIQRDMLEGRRGQLAQILAAFCHAGVHPAQEEQWIEDRKVHRG